MEKNKISNQYEIYDDENQPPKDKWLFALFAFRPLLRLNFFRNLLIKKLRHCENVIIHPDISFIYGKIHAKNAQLYNTQFIDYSPIYIGEGTKFMYNNTVITSHHDIKEYRKIISRPIHIGKNVIITSNCIILGGVSIGDNSIIGAGSIVVKDIPSNCFACGNPCRVIKYFKKGERGDNLSRKITYTL